MCILIEAFGRHTFLQGCGTCRGISDTDIWI